MFYGRTFIFDGIPSENYNLQIFDFDERGSSNSPAGSESTIYQTWLYRKPKPYFYGKSFETPLEFDLTIGSLDPITGFDRSLIEKWLLGRHTYLQLQICQDDIADIILNVIFTSAENIYVGNVQRGMVLHAQCDAPYGFTEEKTLSYVFGDGVIQDFSFDFDNQSDDTGYLYPTITFKTNDIGTYMVLINSTDNRRDFGFGNYPGVNPGDITYDPITPNETISVNNYLQTIETDSGLNRLSNFSKKWFRLFPGVNRLVLAGGLSSFDMTYKFAKKIGA